MPVEVDAIAPSFTLPDAETSQSYQLTDALQRGPVLLSIYKSSCAASKTLFPFLEMLRQAIPDRELTIWGIAQDSANVTRSFTRRSGVSFPMLVDQNDYDVSRAYDILATPSTYLIDQSGKVLWARMGFQKPSVDELARKIADLLGGQPVDITSGSDNVPAWVPG